MENKNINKSGDVKIKKYYIKAILVIESPLILGSGETENSEYDLIRDWYGEIFIPGSSIAGAIRSYLTNILSYKDLINSIFGKRETKDDEITYQSIITFYDAYLIENSTPKITIRDGIKVDPFKKVTEEKKKFDFEILEPSVKFLFKLEMDLYQKHSTRYKQFENIIYLILKSLKDGSIKFGAKKFRGFGNISLDNIQILRLDLTNKDDAESWLNFNWDNFQDAPFSLDKLCNTEIKTNKNFCTITANLEIPYSLLIREYSSELGEADVISLSANYNGETVQIIPGTSWTGAIRTAIYNIFINFKKSDIWDTLTEIINNLFGFVDETNSNAQASRLTIYESVINNNRIINYTRNQVDRFTGGTVEGSLFTEGVSYTGNVSLTMEIQNPKDYEIGLLLFGICEIWYGLQPIGGTTSIGRGIFEGKSIEIFQEGKNIKIFENPEDNDNIKRYFKSLAEKLKNKN